MYACDTETMRDRCVRRRPGDTAIDKQSETNGPVSKKTNTDLRLCTKLGSCRGDDEARVVRVGRVACMRPSEALGLAGWLKGLWPCIGPACPWWSR
jgi:hypothetical protein